MGSKYEAIRQVVLQALEQYYDQVAEKGLSKKAFLRKLFGDKSDTIYMRINGMRKDGKTLTEWDMKVDTLEELLNHLGFTIVPVVLPKDETEEIEELEEISVKSLRQINEHFQEVIKELEETGSSNRRRNITNRTRRTVNPDEEFLKKLQQVYNINSEETETEEKETVVNQNNKDDDIDNIDNIFDD